MRNSIISIVLLSLGGCASVSTMPLAQDTVKITSRAAPVCGAAGAEKLAIRQAAVETLKRGYDRFLIVGGKYSKNISVVGYTPVVANTTASVYGGYGTAYGTARTTYSGGQPIIAGNHSQGLVVKMFKEGDAAGANAISARETLGPKWLKKIKKKKLSCLSD